MSQEKDLSLLRPFDAEKAKAGEPICWCDGRPSFYHEAHASGIVLVRSGGTALEVNPSLLRMAPLAWVEGKPVYKGDVLYARSFQDTLEMAGALQGGATVTFANGYAAHVDNLSWEVPAPQPDSDGWIKWEGGECPVRAGTLVDVRYRDLRIFTKVEASNIRWLHRGNIGDIIEYRIVQNTEQSKDAPPASISAQSLLERAAGHMKDRAATYDKPEGERSMAATVIMFNTATGRDLRESEGWLFMELLKIVRSEQRSDPHADSVEDTIAYAALYGEARLGGK